MTKRIGWALALAAGVWLAHAQAAGIALVKAGASKHSIVVDAKAPASAQLAAREIQRVIKASTGAELPIRNEPASPAIFVGASAAAEQAGIHADKLPYEAHVLRTRGQDIFIVGRDVAPGQEKWRGCTSEGTLYGAYKFLERVTGVRWLMPGPDGEDIPTNADLVVAELNIQDQPGFQYRSIPYVYDTEKTVQEWKARQGVHERYRISFGHSWDDHPPLSVLKAHPEYLRMRADGTRDPVPAVKEKDVAFCASNPGLIRAYAESVMEAFAKDPKKQHQSLSPSDGYDGCDCPECQKLTLRGDKGKWNNFGGVGKSLTPLILNFYNGVGRIVKEQYPDRIVGGLIYRNYLYPLDTPIPIEPNVMLDIAQLNAYGYKHYKPARSQEFKAFLPEWAKVAKRLGWSDYSTWMRNEFGAVLPPGLGIMKMIYPALKKNGILMCHTTGHTAWGEGMATNYLIARLMWNPDADVDAEYKEFLDRAYGPEAGAVVAKIHALAEEGLSAYIRAYEKPRDPDYDVDYECMRQVYAPRLAQFEKLWAEAAAKKMTGAQRKRLNMLGDIFVVMHYNLRACGLIANAEKSPFYKNEAGYRAFLKERAAGISLGPEMKLGPNGEMKLVFSPERRELVIPRVKPGMPPLALDGGLNDPAWSQAAVATDFRLQGSRVLAAQQTLVRMMYDDKALYIGVECRESRMDKILMSSKGLDSAGVFTDDTVELFIGQRPNFEETYWHVAITPGNARYDDVAIEKDYNLKMDSATKLGKDAWTVEIVIPFASLGLKEAPAGKAWRGNICRIRKPDPREVSAWNAIEAGFHAPKLFGVWRFAQ